MRFPEENSALGVFLFLFDELIWSANLSLAAVPIHHELNERKASVRHATREKLF